MSPLMDKSQTTELKVVFGAMTIGRPSMSTFGSRAA
jgi:hypothetical protein